jgi:hypothetical protein
MKSKERNMAQAGSLRHLARAIMLSLWQASPSG